MSRKSENQQMYIGKLATATGLSVQAIRYYESEGLLESSRTRTKYRLYNEDHVRRLQFIQRTQALGFTIREVAQILQILDSEPTGCDAISGMALDKLKELELRSEGLRQLQETLRELTVRCAGGERFSTCALINHIIQPLSDTDSSV